MGGGDTLPLSKASTPPFPQMPTIFMELDPPTPKPHMATTAQKRTLPVVRMMRPVMAPA